MTPRAPVSHPLSAEVADARDAMHAIVSSRRLSWKEDEPGYPTAVAELARRAQGLTPVGGPCLRPRGACPEATPSGLKTRCGSG
jgi:hypothetical protein